MHTLASYVWGAHAVDWLGLAMVAAALVAMHLVTRKEA
jgi:heme exporter protein D